MRRSPLLLPLLLFAGCGGGDSGSDTISGTPAEAFASKCGSCHTLAAADTSGTFGPNLDDLAPSIETVEAAIAAGPGDMPAGIYEGAAAEQIAAFVANSAGD